MLAKLISIWNSGLVQVYSNVVHHMIALIPHSCVNTSILESLVKTCVWIIVACPMICVLLVRDYSWHAALRYTQVHDCCFVDSYNCFWVDVRSSSVLWTTASKLFSGKKHGKHTRRELQTPISSDHRFGVKVISWHNQIFCFISWPLHILSLVTKG